MQKADEPDSHAVNRNNKPQVTADTVWTVMWEMQQCGETHALAHAEGEQVGPTMEENTPQRMRRGTPQVPRSLGQTARTTSAATISA